MIYVACGQVTRVAVERGHGKEVGPWCGLGGPGSPALTVDAGGSLGMHLREM